MRMGSSQLSRRKFTNHEGEVMDKEIQTGVVARDVDVERSTDGKIYLPQSMEIDDAILWLQRKKKEENQMVSVVEILECFPPDGAVALMRAMKAQFGWTALSTVKGMFGDEPPVMIDVETGPHDSIKVPWGQFEIPGVSGHINTAATMKDGLIVFAITGNVKQKHYHIITELADRTRELVATQSIYRGKAFAIEYNEAGEGEFGEMEAPKFLDLTSVKPSELIFSKELAKAVNDYVFTPILHPNECEKAGVPVKRGICLLGPFGTGKTLTAYVAAKHCETVERTFVYLKDVSHLAGAIRFAQQYAPAVVFAEDIDRVVTGARTAQIDEILNTLDGVDSKESKVMVIMTTNNIDKVSRAILRPGRIDVALHIGPPDREAAIRLVEQYARGQLVKDIDLTEVGDMLEGHIPAVIREAVERAKLSSIGRREKRVQITSEDLLLAARTLVDHVAMMSEEAEDQMPVVTRFGEVMGSAFARGLRVAANEGTLDADEVSVLTNGEGAKGLVVPTVIR